jgi:hypothetical protein
VLKVTQFRLLFLCITVAIGQVSVKSFAWTDNGGVDGETDNSPLADWPLDRFDHFTRIEIGRTPKPWLNILGNGLFGGHLILLLGNRKDGREFRVNTRQSAITHTDLHFDGLPTLKETTHGIGYSTFTFAEKPDRRLRVTYFVEPDMRDSEIWLLDNAAGIRVTLRYGRNNTSFERSVALRIAEDRIEEIPAAAAREKLSATQQTWQRYLALAVEHMRILPRIDPILLREFLWDIYQVVAMVSTDLLPSTGSPPVELRNANMGGTYTVLGLDVHGRDTLQMVPAISRFDPVLAREILLNMARYTDRTGRVCHRRLLSGPPVDRGHSDESYWLVGALVDYLRITHDLAIVEERVPYLENDLVSEYVLFSDPAWVRSFETKNIAGARFTSEQTSMLEHARRALENVGLGPHGLPRMEDGDWNDALNKMQKGESVMNAGLYAYCLLRLEELWQQLGKEKVDRLLGTGSFERDLQQFSGRYDAIKKAANAHAWDGQWYVRGFDNQGKAFGSHANAEGEIYLNAQSWLILGNIPDKERTRAMVRSVNKYLRKNNQLSLLTPAYTRRDDNIGNITYLPRGSNENGGQWRQCTLWWIAALRKLGETADALLLFEKLLLANADLEKMETEAYLYNEYLRGPEASDPGSAGQQAHVQQAALVLATLAELYPQVKVTEAFTNHYDFPSVKSEDQLYSFTASGEKVPWAAKWVANPAEYRLNVLADRP